MVWATMTRPDKGFNSSLSRGWAEFRAKGNICGERKFGNKISALRLLESNLPDFPRVNLP